MALETADTDITINTTCPAYVKTPSLKNKSPIKQNHGISEEEVIQKIMLEPMPKKSFIDLEEIAETVAFLSSNAAKNTTGQTMVLDGGWTQNNSNYGARNYGTKRSLKNPLTIFINCGFLRTFGLFFLRS